MQSSSSTGALSKLEKVEQRLRPMLTWTRDDASFLEKLWFVLGAGQPAWGGADVKIVTRRPEPTPDAFYPEPTYVVTPHAATLSGAFVAIRELGSEIIDYENKLELYGEMAHAAIAYHQDHGPGAPEGAAAAAIEAPLQTLGTWRLRGTTIEPIK